VTRLLALAHWFENLIADRDVHDSADLARLGHVTHAKKHMRKSATHFYAVGCAGYEDSLLPFVGKVGGTSLARAAVAANRGDVGLGKTAAGLAGRWRWLAIESWLSVTALCVGW